MSKNAQYAAVLGVKVTAKLNEIKAAYYGKARLYHPDKVGASKDSHDRMVLVNQAYEALSELAKACDSASPGNRHPSGNSDFGDTEDQADREWRTSDEIERMLDTSARRLTRCIKELTAETTCQDFRNHGSSMEQDLLDDTYNEAKKWRTYAEDHIAVMNKLKSSKKHAWVPRKHIYDFIATSIGIREKAEVLFFESQELVKMAERMRAL